MEGKFACKACSRGGSSPLMMNTDNVIFHMCKTLTTVGGGDGNICYSSRSFILQYDVTSGLDQNVSEQDLNVSNDNVSSFFFLFYCRQQSRQCWKGY